MCTLIMYVGLLLSHCTLTDVQQVDRKTGKERRSKVCQDQDSNLRHRHDGLPVMVPGPLDQPLVQIFNHIVGCHYFFVVAKMN